jgi:hypothetical protein
MRDKYYEAALAMVKRYGYEGDELPKYRPGFTSENCPIAIALNGNWGYSIGNTGDDIQIDLEGEEADLVAAFVYNADHGQYPELSRYAD